MSSTVKRSPREQAWEWILTNPNFTCSQLRESTGIPHHIAYQLARFLVSKGRIKVVIKGRGSKPAKYKLIDPSPIQFGQGTKQGFVYNTGRKKSVKQKCWNAMRVLRRFSIGDIATGADINRTTASKYIRSLTQAGFIRCLQKPSRGNEHTIGIYMLIHDSGPLYPLNKKDCVIDQNTGEEHPYRPEAFKQKLKSTKEPTYEQQKLA